MNLYKCTPADLELVISIGRETYYNTFHAMNSSETMAKYLDEAFDRNKIEKELKNPNSSFFFLYDNDSLVAYMKVNIPPAQTDLNDPKSLELERIYVKNEYKGKGYGKILIEKTISIARGNKYDYVWLGVWEKNQAALAFYKKRGFQVFDRHTFRMGDEVQDDFLLKLDLAG